MFPQLIRACLVEADQVYDREEAEDGEITRRRGETTGRAFKGWGRTEEVA